MSLVVIVCLVVVILSFSVVIGKFTKFVVGTIGFHNFRIYPIPGLISFFVSAKGDKFKRGFIIEVSGRKQIGFQIYRCTVDVAIGSDV